MTRRIKYKICPSCYVKLIEKKKKITTVRFEKFFIEKQLLCKKLINSKPKQTNCFSIVCFWFVFCLKLNANFADINKFK